MMRKIGLGVLLTCSLFGASSANAQEDKFSITPSGRILMDAGVFHSNNKDIKDGVAIPDMRVGVKASYGPYKAKVDIGYAYGKVNLKDIFVQRQFGDNHLVKLGYFVHQFGLQSATSSSMKITMEEPASNEAFFNNRLIGAMYIYNKGNYFATVSVHVENEAIKKSSDQTGKQGYGAMSRLVYRPLREDGKIFQIGISGAYETPRYNDKEELNHKSFILKSKFPSRIAKVTAQEANITDAKRLYKFTPEMAAGIGRIGLETQYYYLNVKRENGLSSYKATGAYALLRGLLIGDNYKYSDNDSGFATPAPKSLEMVLGYNYTDMSDKSAEVLGGRMNDASVTFNYYINKYMIWKLRYSYTHVSNRMGVDNQSLNALQTRFQIIF